MNRKRDREDRRQREETRRRGTRKVKTRKTRKSGILRPFLLWSMVGIILRYQSGPYSAFRAIKDLYHFLQLVNTHMVAFFTFHNVDSGSKFFTFHYSLLLLKNYGNKKISDRSQHV